MKDQHVFPIDRWRAGREAATARDSISLRPTRAGWAFCLLLLALLLMAINYSNNLVLALWCWLLAALPLAAWAAWRNLRGVEVQAAVPAPVFAGQAARLPLRLSADGSGGHYGLQLAVGERSESLPQLPAGATASLALHLPCPQRGLQPLAGLRLSSSYPFGLFRASRLLPLQLELLVWPSPAPQADLPPQPVAGSAADTLAGLRPYVAGDAPRRIDWRALARRGELLVRHFEGDSGAEGICIDWQRQQGGAEQRLSALAAQVLAADADGLAFSLSLPGRHLPLARGEAQRLACLAALALFDGGDDAAA